MNKIDVHIITRPSERKDWLHKCLDSLSGEPVNIFFVDGIEGHTGRGREIGYSLGTSPYVCAVDPDDIVIPGAFQLCLDAMTEECCGVYTDEIIIDKDDNKIRDGYSTDKIGWDVKSMKNGPVYVHHIAVMKREFVEKHISEIGSMPILSEYLLSCRVATYGPWIHLPIVGYKWRLHKNGAHKSFSSDAFSVEHKAATRTIKMVCKELEKMYAL